MSFYDLSTIQGRSGFKPRKKAYWHRITANFHIGIRVTKTKGVFWTSRIRQLNGYYAERTLGPATTRDGEGNSPGAFGFGVAMRRAETFRKGMHKFGKAAPPYSLWYNGQLTICPVGDVITVGHALHHYVEWRRIAASPSTFASNLSSINYHIVPRLADIPLNEFNGEHFHQFCRDVLETRANKHSGWRADEHVAISDLTEEELRKRKKTLNGLISILRVAFNLAWDRGEMEGDRAIRCLRQLPNHQRPRPSYLTRPQCLQLLAHADSPQLHDLVAAGLYTGCRVAELTHLRARDVADQCFGIHITRSKNHRLRFVFLPVEGMAFFLNLCRGKAPDDLVLVHADGRPWRKRYVHQFKRSVRRAGLPDDICFHTLRHSYASQLVEDGTPLSIVARQLGHASTEMVDKVYGHLSPSWSERTIEQHFAPLLPRLDISADVQARLDELKLDPTGLARTGADRRLTGPVSKSETMENMERDMSWPRSNPSLFQGPLLADLAPRRRNAPR